MPLKKSTPDFILIVVHSTLLAIGLVMVYSASAVWADYKFDDSIFLCKESGALRGCRTIRHVFHHECRVLDMEKLVKSHHHRMLRPPCTRSDSRDRGVEEWFQELDRCRGLFDSAFRIYEIAMIAFLSKYLSENQKYITSFRKGVLPALLLVSYGIRDDHAPAGLGTGTVMVGTSVVMIFISGARIKHFVGLGMIGLLGFVGLVISAPYRIKRITSFLDPWQDPLNSGFQIIQSLYAIGPGGLFGFGLGQSRQKFFYLPEPQNDFIFAILAEELGFIGGTLVLILFSLILWRGIGSHWVHRIYSAASWPSGSCR